MSAFELIRLAVLAVLVGFLCYKYHQRVFSRSEHSSPQDWTGKAIDATDLNRTLKRVRSDYLAARPKPKGVCFHRGLIGFARRAVARLPYFHDREHAGERL